MPANRSEKKKNDKLTPAEAHAVESVLVAKGLDKIKHGDPLVNLNGKSRQECVDQLKSWLRTLKKKQD